MTTPGAACRRPGHARADDASDARSRSASTLRRPAAGGRDDRRQPRRSRFVSVRLARRGPGGAPADAVVSGASATPSATAHHRSPAPRSSVPEALAAYRSFQQSFRDADWNAAMTALIDRGRARPDLAAAHLRLAFMRSLESVDEGLVRTTFMQAAAQRPHARRARHRAARRARAVPAERPERPARVRAPARGAAGRSWPLDAEIAYVLGSVRYDRGDFAAAVEAFDAAIAIDPDFALAWSTKGGCLAYLGRFDDARAALEEALRRSRTATEPLWYEAEIDEQQGRVRGRGGARPQRGCSAIPTTGTATTTWRAPSRARAGRRTPCARRSSRSGRASSRTIARSSSRSTARLLAIATGNFVEAEQRLKDLEDVARGGAGGAGARRVARPARTHRGGDWPPGAGARRRRGVPRAQGRVGTEPPRRRRVDLPRSGPGDARRAGRAPARHPADGARREARGVAGRVAREDERGLPRRPLDRGLGGACELARRGRGGRGCAPVVRWRPRPSRRTSPPTHSWATRTCSPTASTKPWRASGAEQRRAPC